MSHRIKLFAAFAISLVSTNSLLWTQFQVLLDTKWTPNWTPKEPPQQQDQVYQISRIWCLTDLAGSGEYDP
jgi:hypothetical protein